MEGFRTRDSNAQLIHVSKVTPGKHVLTCPVKGTAYGDTPRLIISHCDNGDAILVEVTVKRNHGSLRLLERVSGVERQIGEEKQVPGIKPGILFTLGVCCDSGKVAAMAQPDEGKAVRCRGESTVCGDHVGMGTGIVVDEVFWGLFYCSHHNNHSASCPEHRDGKAKCPNCGEVCPCCVVDEELLTKTDPSYLSKLTWAREYFDSFKRDAAAWIDSKPYEIVNEQDTNPPAMMPAKIRSNLAFKHRRIRIVSIDKTPTQLAKHVGGCISELRSSLDHLALSLAKAHTPGITPEEIKNSEFPIFGEEVLNKKTKTRKSDVSTQRPSQSLSLYSLI